MYIRTYVIRIFVSRLSNKKTKQLKIEVIKNLPCFRSANIISNTTQCFCRNI